MLIPPALAVLPEITLRDPAVDPPMALFAEGIPAPVLIQTPLPFPTAVVPEAFVPIRFPCTKFPLLPLPMIRIPILLPEMRLPAPLAVPPTVLPPAPFWIRTPVLLAKAAVPVGFVPILFPSTKFAVVPLSEIWTPMKFPEIVLLAPAAVPPTVLPVAPFRMKMPLPWFPTATVPFLSVPMKFPLIEVPVAAEPVMRIASPVLPELTLRCEALVPPAR